MVTGLASMFTSNRRQFLLLAPLSMLVSYSHTGALPDLVLAILSFPAVALYYELFQDLDESGLVGFDRMLESSIRALDLIRTTAGAASLLIMVSWTAAMVIGLYNSLRFFSAVWQFQLLTAIYGSLLLFILIKTALPTPVSVAE